jgi:hypothetical protein
VGPTLGGVLRLRPNTNDARSNQDRPLESAPRPIFGNAVSDLFDGFARPKAARDHSPMASRSRQRRGRPALVVAVVVPAVLAVLPADRPGRVPTLELPVADLACS